MADAQITDLVSQGVFASRPAAADAVEYYATDTKVRYYSNGVSWSAQPAKVEDHSAATITSGTVDIARVPTGATGSTVPFGNDARFTDSRTPTAHATSHKTGGSDSIALDTLAAPTDITTLNASTSAHGLMPKGSGSTTTFYRSDMTQAVPAGAAALVCAASRRTSGDYTTTSTTFVDIDGTNWSFTLVTGARRVRIGLVASVYGSVASAASFDILLDGTRIGNGTNGLCAVQTPASSNRANPSFTYLSDVLSAGSHTIKLQWRTGTGTLTMDGSNPTSQFWAEETDKAT